MFAFYFNKVVRGTMYEVRCMIAQPKSTTNKLNNLYGWDCSPSVSLGTIRSTYESC